MGLVGRCKRNAAAVVRSEQPRTDECAAHPVATGGNVLSQNAGWHRGPVPVILRWISRCASPGECGDGGSDQCRLGPGNRFECYGRERVLEPDVTHAVR